MPGRCRGTSDGCSASNTIRPPRCRPSTNRVAGPWMAAFPSTSSNSSRPPPPRPPSTWPLCTRWPPRRHPSGCPRPRYPSYVSLGNTCARARCPCGAHPWKCSASRSRCRSVNSFTRMAVRFAGFFDTFLESLSRLSSWHHPPLRRVTQYDVILFVIIHVQLLHPTIGHLLRKPVVTHAACISYIGIHNNM